MAVDIKKKEDRIMKKKAFFGIILSVMLLFSTLPVQADGEGDYFIADSDFFLQLSSYDVIWADIDGSFRICTDKYGSEFTRVTLRLLGAEVSTGSSSFKWETVFRGSGETEYTLYDGGKGLNEIVQFSLPTICISDGWIKICSLEPGDYSMTYIFQVCWYCANTEYTGTISLPSIPLHVEQIAAVFAASPEEGGTAEITFDTEGFTVTAEPNEGYRFAGWFLKDNGDFITSDKFLCGGEDEGIHILSGKIQYLAKFEKIPEYTVSFNTDGGGEIAAQTVKEGACAAKPDDPVKIGYTFAGWYADEALTDSFDFETAIMAETIVYAKWEEAAAPVYTLEGPGEIEWTKGSTDSVKLTVKRDLADETCFSHFTGVTMDGTELVRGVDYDAEAGSTVVTIYAAALEKCEAGKHTVIVNFDDGSVEAVVTVAEAEEESEQSEASGDPVDPDVPQTGDEGNYLPWIVLMAVSAAGIVTIIMAYRRERKAEY